MCYKDLSQSTELLLPILCIHQRWCRLVDKLNILLLYLPYTDMATHRNYFRNSPSP